jgi:hypothetical protein
MTQSFSTLSNILFYILEMQTYHSYEQNVLQISVEGEFVI